VADLLLVFSLIVCYIFSIASLGLAFLKRTSAFTRRAALAVAFATPVILGAALCIGESLQNWQLLIVVAAPALLSVPAIAARHPLSITKKWSLIGTLVMVILAACWTTLWVHKIVKVSAALELIDNGNPSPEEVVTFLSYDYESLRCTALGMLERWRYDSPDARVKATRLLEHESEYVWYTACKYLASLGDPKSVPYLIRGLNHPAWRSRPHVVAYRTDLTEVNLGDDKGAWVRWWRMQHPSQQFEFGELEQYPIPRKR